MTEEVGDRGEVNDSIRRLGIDPRQQPHPEGEEENPEGEVRIAVPAKEPEVDPAHYRDVENLLFRGFLVLPAEINGVRFIFKSMNHHEFEFLQWYTSGRSRDEYYNAFMAYGVFMVDGQNILPERERWLSSVEETFSSLTSQARSKIVRYLSEVNRRAANAITLAEAFQIEKVSRFRWAQLKGIDLMSPGNTGVQGTHHLGLNFAQLVWRALNHFDDLRECAEREWDNAKFIGSCFAGKEMKKVYNQDKERREKEREERVQRRDQLLRHVLLGEEINREKAASQYQIVTARSVEELASQLERDLRGEKDWHDQVVEREEARLREQELQRQQHMREMYQTRVDANPNETFGGSDPSQGFSPQEVKERVIRQRQLEAQRGASRIVLDERMESFLSKYVTGDGSTPTPTVRTTDRDPSHAQPVVPPRAPGTPFRR